MTIYSDYQNEELSSVADGIKAYPPAVSRRRLWIVLSLRDACDIRPGGYRLPAVCRNTYKYATAENPTSPRKKRSRTVRISGA